MVLNWWRFNETFCRSFNDRNSEKYKTNADETVETFKEF